MTAREKLIAELVGCAICAVLWVLLFISQAPALEGQLLAQDRAAAAAKHATQKCLRGSRRLCKPKGR